MLNKINRSFSGKSKRTIPDPIQSPTVQNSGECPQIIREKEINKTGHKPSTQAKVYRSSCGYATMQGREDWLKSHGYDRIKANTISESLVADPDPQAPLYYWQIYSLTGPEPIISLVQSFYGRVYEDRGNMWFRNAFTRISGMDHHIATQAAFWVDSMGGGRKYHGGNNRLNFHHFNNADDVMTAEGATLWMSYMRIALQEHEDIFNSIDTRIFPCLVDFLHTKMKQYASDHGWKFRESDFDGILPPIADSIQSESPPPLTSAAASQSISTTTVTQSLPRTTAGDNSTSSIA